ncbi:helix-turn-helix domain-containing protein [Kaistia dalseonensis]|uniref:IclR family mhp operon transcriptional activator n=1 Tax=Kaistia dalseonensis TaxID=410840 RepID=A0ABU0H760_9HYPH|nr:IclR family transcriptional regulator C-terminal domain-containing protein [Kaistia dalseonensis]MCX5495528.1 helix-turn-helix domain-containing protein [Kaistia dalseonensis]MDQ0438120.1 IclR family mhp operon transcriptional activator [Kaistia dalseonensis]
MSDSSYRNVRALERGLDILMELNQRGHARPSELAEATGIDRTTVYRLLATLAKRGLVAQRAADDSYGLLPAVRQLSEGFTDTDWIAAIIAPELGKLMPQVLWPSDFATFEKGWMVIRETTHRFSPFSVHRSMIGRRRPLTRSALGLALLSAASEAERTTMLEITARAGTVDSEAAADRRTIDRAIADVQRRGYAWSIGGSDSAISAIALPIRGPQHVLGSVNVLFFRSAMSIEDAAERYLPALRACVQSAEEAIARTSSAEAPAGSELPQEP